MAKSFIKKEKEVKAAYPSPFGSHTSMICEDKVAEVIEEARNRPIVCKDEKGYYITIDRNIDSGISDPYRTMSINERNKRCEEHGIKQDETTQ